MSPTSSQWLPSVGAPDLSNVLSLAGRAGALSGTNDFQRTLLEMRNRELLAQKKEAKQEADKAAKEEKEKAAEDLGNEPESEGFWQKIGDFAGEGLERTLDVLSRFNYASANMADYLTKQDEDNGEELNFLEKITHSPLTNISGIDIAEDLDLSDIGGTLKAGWRGLSGKDKTTYADVLKNTADRDKAKNFYDSGLYQGITGFGLDVLLDPTTYVGAGIISKPLKKAAEAGVERQLVEDVHKLGLTKTVGKADEVVEVPLSQGEIYVMLGGEPARNLMPKGLSRRQQRQWQNAHTVKGRTRWSKSEQVARTRARVDGLERLRTALRKNPSIPTEAAVKGLDDLIETTGKELKAATEAYGKRAYREALRKFDKNPEAAVGALKADQAKVATETAQVFEDALDTVRVAHAFKVSNKVPFEDSLGAAYAHDPRITPEFRETAVKSTTELARNNKRYRQVVQKIYSKDNGLKRRVDLLRDKLEDAAPGTDEFRKIRSQYAKEKNALDHAFIQMNQIKASFFLKMLSHHVGDKSLLNGVGEQYSSLLAREAEITQKLENLPAAVDSPNTPMDSIALQQELKEVKRHQADLLNDAMTQGDTLEVPVGTPKDVRELFTVDSHGDLVPKADLSPELEQFARAVAEDIDLRTEINLADRIKTWKRRKREERQKPLELAPKYGEMFEGKTPKITLDGKTVLKNSEGKKALQKYVNDADREKYRTESTNAQDKVAKDDENGQAVLDGTENTVADVAAKANVTKTGFAAQAQEYNAFDRLFKEQHGISLETAAKSRKGAAIEATQKVPEDYDPRIPVKLRDEFKVEAREDAIKSVNRDMADGNLRTIMDKKVNLQYTEAHEADVLENVHDTATATVREQYAADVARAKMQNPRSNKVNALRSELTELRNQRDAKLKLLDEGFEEAVKARKAMAERIDEQVILNAIEESVAKGKNYLRFEAGGFKLLDIPSPAALTKATEKLSGLPIIQAANKAWTETFKPASKLEPELNAARLRAQSRTPDLIKMHLDELMQNFSKFKPAERRAALKAVMTGAPVGNQELYDNTLAFFDRMLPYTSRQVTVGDETLELMDLNKYLPDEFKFMSKYPGGIVNSMTLDTPQKLIKAMRNLRPDTDSMKVMWRLEIAIEQAMAYKAMQNVIRKTFGVYREAEDLYRKDLIESLHSNHGWETVRDMGDEYYFPKDVADQVSKLMDMMKPMQQAELLKIYDKALRAWKSAVTVYNPGYYTRNGIGEVLMGVMDGLSNPKYYGKAAQVLRYGNPDRVKETLKSIEPWAKHATTAQQGAKPVITLKGGKTLSVEDINVLYHEVGLKSGFVSTEYEHYFPSANTARGTAVGQIARKTNDSFRNSGEKFEDFFRLAHFMYRMEKSGHRKPLQAAEEAAQYVRKYHYDYTDFTPVEKSVMMRLIPFYKWTRKSLPLMASMLFTSPGKVMLYPKAMTGISYATGGSDPSKDQNGFVPNYDEVVPEWMRNMFSYPVGRDEAEAMDYMNVATPQMDIYKMIQNPVSQSISMMTPFLKVPLEQATGQTLDPDFKMQFDEVEGSRLDNLLRLTPGSSFLNKIYDNRGEGDSAIAEPGASPLDEALTSFLTGLGFYENNERRQKGETFRRNLEKAK